MVATNVFVIRWDMCATRSLQTKRHKGKNLVFLAQQFQNIDEEVKDVEIPATAAEVRDHPQVQ